MDERAAVDRFKRGDIGGLDLPGRARQGAFVRAYERIGGFDADRILARDS